MPQIRIRAIIFLLLLTSIGSLTIGAASFDTELHHRILNSETAAGPYVNGNIIMFSYSARPGTQVVSLAFEHENYSHFHTFERNTHGVFILSTEIPEYSENLRYRLIVDGLWTIDPNAANIRDSRGILVSSVAIPPGNAAPVPGVSYREDGSTRFVYVGEEGSRVSLVGDFNRWDPYLTPMEESYAYPGVYEVTLRLPPEARYYRFVVNGWEIIDPSNPMSTRNGWGVNASAIR